MSNLVAITHPLTGETYHMHPDLAAAKHHWIHPDPNVPTPPESLPLFDMDALDKVLVRLSHQMLHQTITDPAPRGEMALK